MLSMGLSGAFSWITWKVSEIWVQGCLSACLQHLASRDLLHVFGWSLQRWLHVTGALLFGLRSALGWTALLLLVMLYYEYHYEYHWHKYLAFYALQASYYSPSFSIPLVDHSKKQNVERKKGKKSYLGWNSLTDQAERWGAGQFGAHAALVRLRAFVMPWPLFPSRLSLAHCVPSDHSYISVSSGGTNANGMERDDILKLMFVDPVCNWQLTASWNPLPSEPCKILSLHLGEVGEVRQCHNSLGTQRSTLNHWTPRADSLPNWLPTNISETAKQVKITNFTFATDPLL